MDDDDHDHDQDQATIHSSHFSHHTTSHRDSHDDYQARLSYPHTKLPETTTTTTTNLSSSRTGSSGNAHGSSSKDMTDKRSNIVEMKESPSNNNTTTTTMTTTMIGDEKRRWVGTTRSEVTHGSSGGRSDSEKKIGGGSSGNSGSWSASTTDSGSGSEISTTLGAGTGISITEGTVVNSVGEMAGGGGGGVGLGIDGAGDHDENEQRVERDCEGRPVVYKVYKRRWFGLVQLTLLNIIVSWDVSAYFFPPLFRPVLHYLSASGIKWFHRGSRWKPTPLNCGRGWLVAYRSLPFYNGGHASYLEHQAKHLVYRIGAVRPTQTGGGHLLTPATMLLGRLKLIYTPNVCSCAPLRLDLMLWCCCDYISVFRVQHDFISRVLAMFTLKMALHENKTCLTERTENKNFHR